MVNYAKRIYAVELEEVVLDNLFEREENLEAMVYVKYKNSANQNLADKKPKKQVQKILESYFEDFLSTILGNSDKDFSKEDFASTNGYIIAKNLVFKRESSRIRSEEIHTVGITDVDLEKLSRKGKRLNAEVYVKYKYAWGNGSDKQNSVGCLYYVTLRKKEGGYQVVDIDNKAIETRLAKSAIKNIRKTKEKYRKLDVYFGNLLKGVKDMEK